LFSWAKTEGARFDKIEIVSTQNDKKESNRTAKTLEDINAKQEICFIPKKLLLSESVAKNSKVGKCILKHMNENIYKEIDNEKYPHCVDVICMAAFMVNEHLAQKSFWAPYLNILPESFNMPVFWDVKEIKNLLDGTFLKHMTLERLKWLKRIVEIIQNIDHCDKISFELFLWAYGSITSRAFPKTVSTKNEPEPNKEDWITITEICLYPVLDMFNHHKDCKIVWLMQSEGVSFISHNGISSGAEVNNNYGPKGNENLLSNYGFVLENNTEDYVKIAVGIQDQDPLVETRRQIIKDLSLEKFHMLFMDDVKISEKLLMTTQVMVSNKSELGTIRKLITQNENHDLKKLVCENNTNRNIFVCFQTLYRLLKDKLNLANKGEKRMKKYKDKTYPEIYHLAKVYRQGQQSILKHSLETIESSISNLFGIQSLKLLHLQSDGIDAVFLGFLQGIEELDEDTMLSFVLIHESSRIESPFYEQLDAIKAEPSVCKHALG
jgi:hypothetical protein